jgi:hypothetical protein
LTALLQRTKEVTDGWTGRRAAGLKKGFANLPFKFWKKVGYTMNLFEGTSFNVTRLYLS